MTVKLAWITEQRGRMERGLATMTASVERLRSAVAEVADSRLMPDATAEKIDALRRPVLDSVRSLVKESDEMLAVVWR